MALTLLHFANARLGASFASLGSHGREHRVQTLSTIASLGDLAVLERVQAVIVSGDLFDCAVPAPATLKAVHGLFSKLQHAGIYSVILPGARDPDGIFAPERQPDSAELCPGALILGPSQPFVRLDDLHLIVRAVTLPGQSTIEGDAPASIPLGESGTPTIGLTYRSGGNTLDLGAVGRAFADSGLCYLGVGGDTKFALDTMDSLIMCSPGVPEPLDWGQERGSVAIVHIGDDGKAQVDRRRTGSHSFARRELAVTPENARMVTQLINRLAHPDLAVEVVLTGACPFTVLIDPATIETELAPNFFHLRVVDRTRLVVSSEGVHSFPQGTIVGNFARLMDGRLRDAGDDEQAVLDREAYQLGMNLLQGGSVNA